MAEQAEQERLAAEQVDLDSIAAAKAELERVAGFAAGEAEQARCAAVLDRSQRIAGEQAEKALVAAEEADQDCTIGGTSQALSIDAATVVGVSPLQSAVALESINADLRAAALNGSIAALQSAIAAGGDVETVGLDGLTPLYTAAGSGCMPVVECLIAARANTNAQCPRTRFSVLHTSSQRGHAQIVALLLQSGADPQLLNKRKKTARDVAAQKKRKDVLDVFDSNASSSITSQDGETTSRDVESARKVPAVDRHKTPERPNVANQHTHSADRIAADIPADADGKSTGATASTKPAGIEGELDRLLGSSSDDEGAASGTDVAVERYRSPLDTQGPASPADFAAARSGLRQDVVLDGLNPDVLDALDARQQLVDALRSPPGEATTATNDPADWLESRREYVLLVAVSSLVQKPKLIRVQGRSLSELSEQVAEALQIDVPVVLCRPAASAPAATALSSIEDLGRKAKVSVWPKTAMASSREDEHRRSMSSPECSHLPEEAVPPEPSLHEGITPSLPLSLEIKGEALNQQLDEGPIRTPRSSLMLVRASPMARVELVDELQQFLDNTSSDEEQQLPVSGTEQVESKPGPAGSHAKKSNEAAQHKRPLVQKQERCSFADSASRGVHVPRGKLLKPSMIAAKFREDIEGAGINTVEDLKYLEPEDLRDLRLIGLDVKSCKRLAEWQSYLVWRSTETAPADDTAVLMDFYQRTQPEFATTHKVEKVMRSYRRKAKKNAATAAANGDPAPEDWKALMYGEYEKQKGVDLGGRRIIKKIAISLEKCGVFHTTTAPETIAPAARAFFQRQERAEIAAKQQQRQMTHLESVCARGEMSPVAERIAQLQKQAARQAETVKIQQAEEQARKKAELIDARIKREAYQEDQRKAVLAKRQAAESAAMQRKMDADSERVERERAERQRIAEQKRQEAQRVAHIAASRRELFVQLEKHEATQSLLAAEATAPAHEEAIRVEAALHALRVQESADVEKIDRLEVRLAEIVNSEKYQREETSGGLARAEAAAHVSISQHLNSTRAVDADARISGGGFSRVQSASATSSTESVAERLSAQRRRQQAIAAETQRVKDAAAWSDRTARELERMEREARWSRRTLAKDSVAVDQRERDREEYLKWAG
eukprot:COSAG02_NODE_4710_length_5072_cov_3.946511_4_plen_1125_part_00